MGDQHLSELCKGNEMGPIITRLRLTVAADDEDASSTMWSYRDDDGRTAFHWAVALKNVSLATQMMKPPYNAPVLSEDSDGITPFVTACMVGAPEPFVQELLERSVASYGSFLADPSLGCRHTEDANAKGASSQDPACAIINAPDSLGNTALLYTVSRGNISLTRFLLRNGADISWQNQRGQSALHRAVSKGSMEMVEELVKASEQRAGQAKASHRRWMDLQDARGDTALFYASLENNEELGRYLLRRGADRELRNKEGKQFWEV